MCVCVCGGGGGVNVKGRGCKYLWNRGSRTVAVDVLISCFQGRGTSHHANSLPRSSNPPAFCLFGCFPNVLVNNKAISRTGPKTERLTILRAATHETKLGDHDFCLSRSHYTDTDPTSRERVATAGIEPGTSSPGVTRSTD